jgi:hypothetical protein
MTNSIPLVPNEHVKRTPSKPIDPSPFEATDNYVIEGTLLSSLWRLAQRAGLYGLTHDENRDLQNLIVIIKNRVHVLEG